MAKVKVKLLTSRAGVHSVSYPDVREQRDEEGNFVLDDEGAHVMEEYVREQDEGWAQNAGQEVEVDSDEAERLVADGQAELLKAAAQPKPKPKAKPQRERKPRKPQAETAEAPAKGESRSAKGGGA